MRALLITAGATHNPIDSMRSITANASGKTGGWLAQELCHKFKTTLMGSPLALANNQAPVEEISFQSTRDLEKKMREWVNLNPDGIVIHSAAVGDYEVLDAAETQKIPSGQSKIHITLVPAPKILSQLRQWSKSLIVVSFKAAPPLSTPEKLLNIAQSQCTKSDSAIVFANVIGRTQHDVFLVTANHHESHPNRHDALESLIEHIKRWQ